MSNRLAAILTCYNRKATTLASLARLFKQELPAELTVFLVDDNSPDGTADEVSKQFPAVRLLRGDGTLFWCGGMRRAFGASIAENFDYYLWLNDDTLLEQGAIARMLAAYDSIANQGYERAICVGSTRDPQTGELTYGGVVRSNPLHPMKYRLLEPGDTPRQCDSMNGNCVLIPRAVVVAAGNLSPEFRHGMGDFDYCLRARKSGCTAWVIPGYVGTCARNRISGGFEDSELRLENRWRHMMSNKGLPPDEYLVYMRRHGGALWPIFWVMPYLRVISSSILLHLRRIWAAN
jgi:GT2 family glycosyltransferase